MRKKRNSCASFCRRLANWQPRCVHTACTRACGAHDDHRPDAKTRNMPWTAVANASSLGFFFSSALAFHVMVASRLMPPGPSASGACCLMKSRKKPRKASQWTSSYTTEFM